MVVPDSSLPYHEPSIKTILILSSLLLLSNVVNWAFDRLVYCGLVGQILVGVAWGTPGAKWLDENIETVIAQLGYLGLVLLVYEGGLSTSFQSLKANMFLSFAVALTGISAPIGLSFALAGIANTTLLQSFAAGAALCSTSLGTTFTILGTTRLLKTRLGAVITSAAMLDDVVGLVMVQLISNLGSSTSDFSAVTIIRPVFVSIAFAVVCPLVCWLILKPMTLGLNEMRMKYQDSFLNRMLCRGGTAFSLHTGLLISMVTGSAYAGTSNLFAAYLAGAMVSWWDTEIPHLPVSSDGRLQQRDKYSSGTLRENTESSTDEPQGLCTGPAIFEKYYQPANDRILKPFFFTSIGFSIPITRMFDGQIVWRAVIYSILMLVGKLLCGFWLVRISMSLPCPSTLGRIISVVRSAPVPRLWGVHTVATTKSNAETSKTLRKALHHDAKVPKNGQDADESSNALSSGDNDTITSAGARALPQPKQHEPANVGISRNSEPAQKPFSLYPGALLGLAMIARGEIGFLISSLAESNGVFSTDGDDQVFLIVTWAIVLCTIIAPLGVGLLVRRVKRLQKAREEQPGSRDVLGAWGVS